MFPGYRLPQSGMIQHLRANGALEMRTTDSGKGERRSGKLKRGTQLLLANRD